MFGDIWDLQKYVNWLCVFSEVNPCFQRAHMTFFVWIYSQLQIHTMLYVHAAQGYLVSAILFLRGRGQKDLV